MAPLASFSDRDFRPMDYAIWDSLPGLFLHHAAERRAANFLWRKVDESYEPLTWGQVDDAVRALARGLAALGLERGDRVLLLSENRPEWLISDLAIMAAGGITVPVYTTNTVANHHHVLDDSGARGAIVSSWALARRFLPAAAQAGACAWMIVMEPLDAGGADQKEATEKLARHHWDDVLALGERSPDIVADSVARIERRDTACFIYTSGTGGSPKGVMLSHGAILCNCMGAHHLLAELGLEQEVFLCFLPLSHAYEHTAGQFFPLSIGAEIYYATSVENLLNNLAEARPTIMTAVPRLYESMYQRILRGVEKQSAIKRRLFHLALELGRKRYRDPSSLTLKERLLDRVVDRLVRDKMRARFGGRLKAMVSGGAALNPDIGLFFTALGLPILQGYGQSEAAPVISANPPGRVKLDTVGPPLAGVEVRIAEDGEILVRGELIMNGYWQNEAATAAVVRDGWLHTGDIGEIDGDGYIKITDRKKDIIVLSGGDNVSPARIEGFLTLQPEIHQAMVYGDKRSHLVAILVPDDAVIRELCGSDQSLETLEQVHRDERLRASLAEVVDRINKDLAPLERVRRFTVARAAFSVENGMMTPTLKIRRHKIIEQYHGALEQLY